MNTNAGIDVSFDELRALRRRLGEICKLHSSSLQVFRQQGEAWFHLTPKDPPSRRRETPRHLSTSATCLSSLLDVAVTSRTAQLQELINEFSDTALKRQDWESDEGGETYCRVRTLPLILEHADPSIVARHATHVSDLVTFAWKEVSLQPPHQGIAEHNQQLAATAADPEPEYPPNSFLTYWGLTILRAAGRHPSLAERVKLRRRRAISLLWTERALASQVALSSVQSDPFDPHQLAWAIATLVEFGDPATLRQPASVNLLQSGLRAFFQAQSVNGGWPRGEPLFHYPKSGNAYCYVFETLAELIRPALFREKGQQLRDLLIPYAGNLVRAWSLAESSREQVAKGAIGWCSAHHPHRTKPESWATAAAFSYIELFRCLVGTWTRDVAVRQLGLTTPRWNTYQTAMRELTERGDTWDPGTGWSAGNRIGALFLNPVLRNSVESELLDPDRPLIDEDQARSAILFGPPGTSKTTSVEALAGALGWDYVEVHASHFLTEGMNNIPARADMIFNLVMELDRCVVLFDEIDELLRDRTAENSDPFGRFLTTSMLPKLARLWNQRRVLFFVNTNWIDAADPAITRSQRFDAALFVLPPSFNKKFDAVSAALTPEARKMLTALKVNNALTTGEPLAWFALIRHDQMAELKVRLTYENSGPANFDGLERALREMGSQLERSDWHVQLSDNKREPQTPFQRFASMCQSERVDGRDQQLARLDRADIQSVDGFELVAGRKGVSESFVALRSGDPAPTEFRGDGWTAKGDTLLQFAVKKFARKTKG